MEIQQDQKYTDVKLGFSEACLINQSICKFIGKYFQYFYVPLALALCLPSISVKLYCCLGAFFIVLCAGIIIFVVTIGEGLFVGMYIICLLGPLTGFRIYLKIKNAKKPQNLIRYETISHPTMNLSKEGKEIDYEVHNELEIKFQELEQKKHVLGLKLRKKSEKMEKWKKKFSDVQKKLFETEVALRNLISKQQISEGEHSKLQKEYDELVQKFEIERIEHIEKIENLESNSSRYENNYNEIQEALKKIENDMKLEIIKLEAEAIKNKKALEKSLEENKILRKN